MAFTDEVRRGGSASAVIRADRLVDGRGRRVVEAPVIVVEGGRIASVTSGDGPVPPGVPVHEFPGCTVLPGLVDGHVHLAFSAAPTTEDVLAEYMEADPVRLVATAVENANRCLCGGVTTVRDCGGPGTLVQSLRDAIAAGVTRGPRIVASGMPITTTGGHCHFFGLRADGEAEVRKAVRRLVEDDADFIKVMATGGRMTRGSNILRAQYTEAEMAAIVDEARRLERRVAAHALSVEGIRNSVRAGVDTVEHCNWQDERGHWEIEEELLDQIARQGTHVSVTLVGYMRDAYDAWRQDPERHPQDPLLRRRFELEGEMFARGLKAFISSDAGVPGSHFAELYRSAVVAVGWLGLDPLTAISAMTSRPAEAIGVAADVGTVEPGKLADLIVVEGDPTARIEDLGALRATFLGGERVVVDGALLPTDPRRVGPRPRALRREGWPL